MPRLKLTKSVIDKLPPVEKGAVVYFDVDMPGFGLRVGTTKKTFIAQRDIMTKTYISTIGVYGIWTPEQARQEARERLLLLSKGIDLVTLCDKGWPKFPSMPAVPGLYRITLNDGRVYIGEARSLKRRLYEYRRPTPGIEQEHRVHAALVASHGGKIDIYTEGDLSTRRVRCLLEKTEIERTIIAGVSLLNEEGEVSAERLRARILFLEAELFALRAKLAKAEKLHN
jgi:hypothetical protein